jgi:hypothetical protein
MDNTALSLRVCPHTRHVVWCLLFKAEATAAHEQTMVPRVFRRREFGAGMRDIFFGWLILTSSSGISPSAAHDPQGCLLACERLQRRSCWRDVGDGELDDSIPA